MWALQFAATFSGKRALEWPTDYGWVMAGLKRTRMQQHALRHEGGLL